MRLRDLALAFSVTLALSGTSLAQDPNVALPVPQLEEILGVGDFQVVSAVTSRGLPSERTYQVTASAGNAMLQMKYAPAPEGADEFNNRPRYELAAYEIQKLFLDPEDYVVPPTVLRCFPTDVVQGVLNMVPADYKPEAEPTFRDWEMTMVLLQYWLWNVEVPEELNDDDLVENDRYAYHLGHFNLLTYLIRHNDSNEGNFLRSVVAENPRIFSVDNGVAFSNEESDRGTYWRNIEVDRFPARAIERLRQVTPEGLQEALGVVAQFELQGGNFVPVEPTENLDPADGIRRNETTVQVGLTDSEIRQIFRRLERLLEWVDDGRYTVFQ